MTRPTSRSLPSTVATAVVTVGTVLAVGASPAAGAPLVDASLRLVETTNSARQHVDGSTLFYNPAQTGSTTATVTATGAASVTFPALWGAPALVDSAPPFTRTYTWAQGATFSGVVAAVARTGSGASRSLPITVSPDSTPPGAGASISHVAGRTDSPSVSVSFTAGSGDAGSGVGATRITRVSRGGAPCTPSDPVTVAADAAASPVVDTGLAPGGCYGYRLAEVDRVGNARVVVSAGAVVLNRPPRALPVSTGTSEDTAVDVVLTGDDPDGDALAYTVVDGPRHGSLTGSGSTWRYSPARDWSGTDVVQFAASDGLATTRATATLAVSAVPDAPVAQQGSVRTAEDVPVPVTLLGTDADGDALTYEVVGRPTLGRLDGVAPALTYVPNPDRSGTDLLTFRVRDGSASSAVASVAVAVDAVNDAPTASAGAVGPVGAPTPIVLAATDADGDALTYRVVDAPEQGVLTGTGPTLTYTPHPGATGTDTLRFTASDQAATSAPATVTVTLQAAVAEPRAFEASGMHGAGFQNVVAVDPRGTGLVLSGADVSGIHRSTDWGRTFTTANTGIGSLTQLHVAALEFSPTTPGKVYAAVGHKGAGGGLLVSTDEGRTWSLRSTVPQFSGSNNEGVPGLPATHPRSTGRLLAFDAARNIIYAATFDDGVMRSTDDGRTWRTLGLAGQHLRSLVVDPRNPEVLYAATYGAGIWKTTTASGAGGFTRLAQSPVRAEELAVADGVLYVAAGTEGVRSSGDGGTTWRQLGAQGVVRVDGPNWLSISARRDPATGRHVLVAGTERPAKVGSSQQADSVVESRDGGTTWSSMTADPARIHDQVGGAGGGPWWLLERQPTVALGRGSFVASQIVVSPSHPDRIFVAGRSGMWASSDAGRNWYPMVHGLQVTINKQVVADPRTPGRIYIANTDWILLYSTDGGRTVVQNRPPSGSLALAMAVESSTAVGALYVGVGERDSNTGGEIYVHADPARPGSWASLGLRAATGGGRPVSVAVQRTGGQVVVIAAVEGSGIWRKVGTGPWQKAASTAMRSTTTKFGSLTWAPGSAEVYLHDPASGVWSSRDRGQTWARVWDRVAPNTQNTTSIAADPRTPGRVYVSVAGDGLYRLDGASSTATARATKLSGVTRPGPVAVGGDGRVVVTQFAGDSSPAALRSSSNAGATWTSLDDATYRGAAGFPFSLALGGDRIYLSLNGNGVLRGTSWAPAP